MSGTFDFPTLVRRFLDAVDATDPICADAFRKEWRRCPSCEPVRAAFYELREAEKLHREAVS